MENNYYYKKYIKYKNKYLELKKNLRINKNLEVQKGGYNSHTNPESIAGKLLEVIQVMRGTFIPNNSSMFQSTFYFNDQKCLELSIQKIYGLKQEAYKYFRNDPSYSAKMSMLDYAINTIEIFLNCAKTKFSEQQILHFINHESKKYFRNITEIPVNNLEFILVLFQNSGIDAHNFICSNTATAITPESYPTPTPSGTRGPGGCTDPNAINYNRYATYNDGSCKYPVNKNSDDGRCVYQDPKCLGDKDVITLDDIDKSNINNVVRVDKKCYDADELQKWLVNNSSLPHNRQKYTSKDLNKCVNGSTNIPNPSSPLNPNIPPISNLNIDPYALNDSYVPLAPYSTPSKYGPLSSTIIQTPLITTSPPITVNSKNNDSSSESSDNYDEPSSDENNEELEYDEQITKIVIQPVKGKKITYTKNGTFELKEVKKKNKDIQFKLEIHVNNKKSYFIQTETKKKSHVNLFYSEDEKSKNGIYKVKEIKSITIEDSDNKVKINYNIKPIKKLIDKIKETITSVNN